MAYNFQAVRYEAELHTRCAQSAFKWTGGANGCSNRGLVCLAIRIDRRRSLRAQPAGVTGDCSEPQPATHTHTHSVRVNTAAYPVPYADYLRLLRAGIKSSHQATSYDMVLTSEMAQLYHAVCMQSYMYCMVIHHR